MRTRRFVPAPPERIFEAWTTPEQLLHWWGPSWNTLDECEVDLRVGGRQRFVSSNADGREFRFHGEFTEVEPGRRLVTTWVFEGSPAHESLNAIDFEPAEGGTLVVGEVRLPSVEARDAQVTNERMILGMNETYDRLEAYLEGTD